MDRQAITMALLALAGERGYTPVQIQKALFLLDREAADLFSEGSRYLFRAYDYGPFDAQVYRDIEVMVQNGLAEILPSPGDRWRRYRVTAEGIRAGDAALEEVGQEKRDFMDRVSSFVRQLSFSELVASIYKAYPEMRENSVFVGD